MRTLKRLIYIVLLNIIVSAITVGVMLQLWQKDHPLESTQNTPMVVIVTPTTMVGSITPENQPTGQPQATDSGVQLPSTQHTTPTLEFLNYRVKENDTLGALAIEFNLSIEDLMIANDLIDPDSLYVGQLIHIPTAPLPKPTSTAIPPTVIASPTVRPSATPTQKPEFSATPTQLGQEPQVMIQTVIGTGVLANERVVLQRTGDGDLSLSGWRLTDGSGNEYIFPMLTLHKDTSINLNTRIGQDTVSDLYWGLTSPIWRSGETVSLYDSQNTLRATYVVP